MDKPVCWRPPSGSLLASRELSVLGHPVVSFSWVVLSWRIVKMGKMDGLGEGDAVLGQKVPLTSLRSPTAPCQQGHWYLWPPSPVVCWPLPVPQTPHTRRTSDGRLLLLARSLARRRRRLLKIRCSTRGPVATPYFLLCGRRLRGKENERAGDLLLLTRPWQRRCDRDGRHFSPNSHPREPGLEAVSLSQASRLPSVCTSVTNGVLGAGAGEPSQQRLRNEVLATFIARVESTSLAGLISISGRDHRDGRKKGEKAKKESAVMVMAGFSCTHPPLHMRVLK
ncbi:hypothetical protein TESG_02238 [Trichophyton tonsurans CBS 112818]|uniref:Uncharacterized protein n=1 Tax=Trichophyton tonsurans (strain CBS 112818) TaxID=647933 RepID=F2RTT3_TRIT1|nr:hypothetical protein TESG_02238 [Trichophyton tonsurans CBS 112818]